MVEITVSIKGSESSYKQKFLIYDTFKFEESDAVIKDCVEQALGNAKIEPDDIKVRGLLQMR